MTPGGLLSRVTSWLAPLPSQAEAWTQTLFLSCFLPAVGSGPGGQDPYVIEAEGLRGWATFQGPATSVRGLGPFSAPAPQGTFFFLRCTGLGSCAISKGSDSGFPDRVRESSTVPSQGWMLHLVPPGGTLDLPVGFWARPLLATPHSLIPCKVNLLTLQSGPGWGWGITTTTDLRLK